jgi:hypothetical protein
MLMMHIFYLRRSKSIIRSFPFIDKERERDQWEGGGRRKRRRPLPIIMMEVIIIIIIFFFFFFFFVVVVVFFNDNEDYTPERSCTIREAFNVVSFHLSAYV